MFKHFEENLRRRKLYFLSDWQNISRFLESFLNPEKYFVFVDGSYRPKVGAGYGAVILRGGKVIHQIVGNMQDVPLALQSLGEFMAVIKSIEWCEARRASHIVINYDCIGIQHLSVRFRPKGHKRKLQRAYRDYHDFMRERLTKRGTKISLRKVKAHSCDFLNNWADRLAKMGLYRLTVAQVKKECGIPRQTCKHINRMIKHIETNPLELQYA